MENLIKLIPRFLREVGDSDEAREQAALAAWAAAVGSHLRRATAPLKLERKTLIVAATDATWRNQLKKMRGETLFRLNSILGAPIVTAIDFVVNEEAVRRAHITTPSISFTAPEQHALSLREKAGRIPDIEAQRTFLRAAGKCLDRRAK